MGGFLQEQAACFVFVPIPVMVVVTAVSRIVKCRNMLDRSDFKLRYHFFDFLNHCGNTQREGNHYFAVPCFISLFQQFPIFLIGGHRFFQKQRQLFCKDLYSIFCMQRTSGADHNTVKLFFGKHFICIRIKLRMCKVNICLCQFLFYYLRISDITDCAQHSRHAPIIFLQQRQHCSDP